MAGMSVVVSFKDDEPGPKNTPHGGARAGTPDRTAADVEPDRSADGLQQPGRRW
jgi:hypothetical protein